MLLLDFIKGLIIGVAASVPLGPIAFFVIQKTVGQGRRSGMSAAMGSTLVDTLFAVVSVSALSLVQDFIDTQKTLIMIIGGVVVIALGVSMFFNKAREIPKSRISATDMVKSLLMGLSNPGALAVMLALFAVFGFGDGHLGWMGKAAVCAAVFVGSFAYWLGFTWLLSKSRRFFTLGTLTLLNRITGVVVAVFGIWLIISVL